MSNGVFARLISKLSTPNRASGDGLKDDVCDSEFGDRHDEYLFADLLAASAVLDFGGAPADFFQMHSRRLDEYDASGKTGQK